jgi:hypothetical protein
MRKAIWHELIHHIPFTASGAVFGIAAMAAVSLAHTPQNVSQVLFFTFHPLHVIFSAMVTTAMYRKFGAKRLWLVIIIGYVGSVGIATISDAFIPYLEGRTLSINMAFTVPFLSTAVVPYFHLPEWVLVNCAAAIGIAFGMLRPKTTLPHMTHVLLSTWASLFGFTAFGTADWLPLLPVIFIYLFLAVWLPCCFSDIVFPLLWTGGGRAAVHAHAHH